MANRTLLLAAATAALLIFGEFGITQTYMLLLADRLGADAGFLGSLTALNYLSVLLASVVLAAPSTYSERHVVIVGLVITGFSLMFMPLVGGLLMLSVLAVLKGLARGSVMPSLMGISLKAVDPEARASAMGIFQATYSIGMFGGPLATGIIGQAGGLAAPFYVVGVFTVLATLVVWRFFPRKMAY